MQSQRFHPVHLTSLHVFMFFGAAEFLFACRCPSSGCKDPLRVSPSFKTKQLDDTLLRLLGNLGDLLHPTVQHAHWLSPTPSSRFRVPCVSAPRGMHYYIWMMIHFGSSQRPHDGLNYAAFCRLSTARVHVPARLGSSFRALLPIWFRDRVLCRSLSPLLLGLPAWAEYTLLTFTCSELLHASARRESRRRLTYTPTVFCRWASRPFVIQY